MLGQMKNSPQISKWASKVKELAEALENFGASLADLKVKH